MVGRSQHPLQFTDDHCGFAALLKGTLDCWPSHCCSLVIMRLRVELGHLQERRSCISPPHPSYGGWRWRRCVSCVEQVSTAMHYKSSLSHTHSHTPAGSPRQTAEQQKSPKQGHLFLHDVQHAAFVLLHQVQHHSGGSVGSLAADAKLWGGNWVLLNQSSLWIQSIPLFLQHVQRSEDLFTPRQKPSPHHFSPS